MTRTLPWISTAVQPNTRAMFRHTLDASGVDNAPQCTLDDLLVTADFGGAGGSLYATIDVRNQSLRSCSVQGSPYIGFIDAAGRTPAAYAPHLGASDPRVVLVPTSWAQLGLTPVGPDSCGASGHYTPAPGSTIGAIRFGFDSTSTRLVRVTTPDDCPPSVFGSAGAWEAVPVDAVYGALYAPLRNGLTLDAPRTAERGRTSSFSVTLTDTDPNSFPLVGDGCPLYQVALGATRSTTRLLNCNGSQGLIIAPGSTVRFEMRFAVPESQPIGPATLAWQFVEPSEPALTARVTVIGAENTPVLGRKRDQFERGFGQVRPSWIFLGGDPTGDVDHVHWQSWGGARATGTGIGSYEPPGKIVADSVPAPATVVAFDLGTCRGKRAYQAIEWFYPEHGQTFDPANYINTCTGDYAGDS